MAEKRAGAEAAVTALGLGAVDAASLLKDIDEEIERARDIVLSQRERAAGAVMGPVMAKHRGKVGGKELSALVAARIARWLSSNA
jgi:Glu-tRNA(Gln) amidotransferase subunit E-like FAD-binding protein